MIKGGGQTVNSCKANSFAGILSNMPEDANKPKQYVEIDGWRVRELRRKAKLTQQQLASLVAGEHQLPLSRGYVPTIEKNPKARVSSALAKALAGVLAVSVDRLLIETRSGVSFGAPYLSDSQSEGRVDLLKEILKEIAEINRRTEEIRRVVEELLRSEERVR
jgi:transcriptional regulator with XRE-family HTH domain